MENSTKQKIKVHRSDNLGENKGSEFQYFCTREGIKREWTIPYNLEQNGVGERKNHFILEAEITMTHDEEMPYYIWEKMCSTSVYIQNIVPHMVLGKMTLEKAKEKATIPR